ncbi:hypothetical protein [Dactylosporangium salmoneum]|uniref:Uncharacterized protein n=1 Tax=Dactylosporangium salmoneum TaxID=53361 RepID=A0ABP5TAQ1_9ACTN
MTVDSLPCGHGVEENLFETEGGPRVLITLRAVWSDGRRLMPGKVWCTQGHGWVTAEDGEFERLAAVKA